MRARHHPLLAEGAEHAHAVGLGEGGERLVCALEAHHFARDRDGTLCLRNPLCDGADVIGRGQHSAAWAGLRRRRLVGLAFGHILGQRHSDRSRPAVHGDGEGFRRRRRNLVRRVGLEHRLGHRPQHAVIVDLLKGLAASLIRRNLADEEHERHRVLARGVNANGTVGRAGPAGHEGDARLARQPGVGAGGKGGTGFVAGNDKTETILGRPQRLQHGEVALARHAERGIDAVVEKGRNQRIAAGVGAVRQVLPLCGVRAGPLPTSGLSRLDRTRHGPPPLKPREDTGRRPAEKARDRRNRTLRRGRAHPTMISLASQRRTTRHGTRKT